MLQLNKSAEEKKMEAIEKERRREQEKEWANDWKKCVDEFYWFLKFSNQKPEVAVKLMLTRAIRDLSKYRMGYVG